MTKKSMAVQVAELTTENEHLRERHKDAVAQIRPLEKEVERLRGEVSSLRGLVHQSELRTAEMQGYLKAMSDQTPTRMVPEERRLQVEDLVRDVRAGQYDHRPAAPWFDAGHSKDTF